MEQYIIETKKGKVKGYERDGLIEYLGIPFAKPPVGPLRFKRAQEMDPWMDVLDAKAYGPESIQFDEGQFKGSEDCLTLNVQRPVEGENLPVLVWIHGGGYNTGAASCPLTDGRSFAEHGIVYVSVQYRLNVLGFYDFTTYPGCEDFDSNCGLSDQIMALTWVHENIKAFGGNPENVTIMGESAGGASVINMLAVPAVKGMFQKAIAQSGLPNCVMTHEMARENIDLFIEGMGWTEEDLPKLRTIEPFALLEGNGYVAKMHQYKNPGMFLPGPIQDDLLPVRPIDAIRNGSAKDVKLMIGTNLHEGTMFVREKDTNFPNSWEMVEEMFEKNGQKEHFEEIKEYYTTTGKEGLDLFVDFATDYAFQMPALKVAEAQKAYNSVWMYRYEFVSKSGEASGMKASHAFDMPCMFADKEFGFSKFLFDGEDEAVVDQMIENMHTPWVRFVLEDEPDKENWPKYEGYKSQIRIFDRQTKTVDLDRSQLMSVWDDMRFYEN